LYDFRFYDESFGIWVLCHQTWWAMRKSEERRLAKAGLTPERLAVLWVASAHPGPLTPAEISRAVFRENQTVAGLLDRMEKEGLVRRVPKRKGRPFTEIQMTAKGRELWEQAREVAIAHVRNITSGLSREEREQLQQILPKLRQNALEDLHWELLPAPSWLGGAESGTS
jgi:DNA-binding MarR family transcriptional regulator